MGVVRIGIVGCGVIGKHHLDSALVDDGIQIVAVADQDCEVAWETADKYNVPSVYLSASELLSNPQVEAVVLALPTGVRARIGLESLQKHKHLLLEKPPAMHVRELQELKAIQNDLLIGCCSSRYSFQEIATRAREIIESGVLGEIRVVRCRALDEVTPVPNDYQPPPWRVSHRLNGGGLMANWGVYDLDFLMYVTGWKLVPETVCAQNWPVARHLAEGRVYPDSDAENHVVSLIRCKNGAVINHERAESICMCSEFAWQVTGDQGSLHMGMTSQGSGSQLVLDIYEGNGTLSSEILDRQSDHDFDAGGPIRDFAEAIRNRQIPRTDIDKAICIQSVVDGIYKSARSGDLVQIAMEA